MMCRSYCSLSLLYTYFARASISAHPPPRFRSLVRTTAHRQPLHRMTAACNNCGACALRADSLSCTSSQAIKVANLVWLLWNTARNAFEANLLPAEERPVSALSFVLSKAVTRMMLWWRLVKLSAGLVFFGGGSLAGCARATTSFWDVRTAVLCCKGNDNINARKIFHGLTSALERPRRRTHTANSLCSLFCDVSSRRRRVSSCRRLFLCMPPESAFCHTPQQDSCTSKMELQQACSRSQARSVASASRNSRQVPNSSRQLTCSCKPARGNFRFLGGGRGCTY